MVRAGSPKLSQTREQGQYGKMQKRGAGGGHSDREGSAPQGNPEDRVRHH